MIVVVTGASGGVGRATARRFAAPGNGIALIARGRAGLEGALTEVEAAGARGLVLPCDVADADALDAAAEQVERELGPIDVWINCAMVTVFGEFLDIDADEYRRVTEVTYLGYVNGTRAALRRMLPRDRGVIVQAGSALAFRGIPLQSAYCGAKHAIAGFTESARTELLHRGSNVHLTSVHLPALNTPQFEWGRSKMARRAQPVPPIYQPEVAATALHFAATHRRRQMMVGLPTVLAVETEKLAPDVADELAARVGWNGQLLDQPRDRSRPDNLFRPVDDRRDFGAHGLFDGRAHAHCVQLWLSTHRVAAAALATLILVTSAALLAAITWR